MRVWVYKNSLGLRVLDDVLFGRLFCFIFAMAKIFASAPLQQIAALRDDLLVVIGQLGSNLSPSIQRVEFAS